MRSRLGFIRPYCRLCCCWWCCCFCCRCCGLLRHCRLCHPTVDTSGHASFDASQILGKEINTQSHIGKSFYPPLPFSLSPTLLAGAGLSEELLMLPFSHMLLMLRVPPVGISANGDFGDLTSLFPCGNRGWIKLLLHEQKQCYIDWGSVVESK